MSLDVTFHKNVTDKTLKIIVILRFYFSMLNSITIAYIANGINLRNQ